MSMPMPSPKTGLTFYALTPLGAYRETIPGKVVASTLMAANTDPARGGMADRVPVPAERQALRPWGEADFGRLKMSPPAEEVAPAEPPEDDRRAAAGSQAEEVPGGGFEGGGNAPRASSRSRFKKCWRQGPRVCGPRRLPLADWNRSRREGDSWRTRSFSGAGWQWNNSASTPTKSR